MTPQKKVVPAPSKKPSSRAVTKGVRKPSPGQNERGNRAAKPQSARPPAVPLPGDEELLEKEEPDEQSLAQTSEEWAEIPLEDPLEILEDPSIAIELSEDPVRLYLKEIGQIHLLDADSEFRLAARIEAERRVEALEKAIPADQPNRRQALLLPLVLELNNNWELLQKEAQTYEDEELPDLSLILTEA